MAARFPGVNVVIDHVAMIDIAAPRFGRVRAAARAGEVAERVRAHIAA
jgi:hypothetical protein